MNDEEIGKRTLDFKMRFILMMFGCCKSCNMVFSRCNCCSKTCKSSFLLSNTLTAKRSPLHASGHFWLDRE